MKAILTSGRWMVSALTLSAALVAIGEGACTSASSQAVADDAGVRSDAIATPSSPDDEGKDAEVCKLDISAAQLPIGGEACHACLETNACEVTNACDFLSPNVCRPILECIRANCLTDSTHLDASTTSLDAADGANADASLDGASDASLPVADATSEAAPPGLPPNFQLCALGCAQKNPKGASKFVAWYPAAGSCAASCGLAQ